MHNFMEATLAREEILSVVINLHMCSDSGFVCVCVCVCVCVPVHSFFCNHLSFELEKWSSF